MPDEFMKAAIAEAEAGAREGGIPIGSVLVHGGRFASVIPISSMRFEQRRGQCVEHPYADLHRNRACPVAAAPPRVGFARLTIVVADDAGALSRLNHRAGGA